MVFDTGVISFLDCGLLVCRRFTGGGSPASPVRVRNVGNAALWPCQDISWHGFPMATDSERLFPGRFFISATLAYVNDDSSFRR